MMRTDVVMEMLCKFVVIMVFGALCAIGCHVVCAQLIYDGCAGGEYVWIEEVQNRALKHAKHPSSSFAWEHHDITHVKLRHTSGKTYTGTIHYRQHDTGLTSQWPITAVIHNEYPIRCYIR